MYACLNYHYSDAGLLAMSSELMRLFSKSKLHQSYSTPQRKSAENRVASTQEFQACELLDQTGLSVLKIGAELGYDDPCYFSRLFKKIQGSSPTAYRETIKGSCFQPLEDRSLISRWPAHS